jgi:hypothetical protein
MQRTVWTAAFGAALMIGCARGDEPVEPLGSAILEGDIGNARGFSGVAWQEEASAATGWTSVDIHARGTGWAVMTMMYFNGELGFGELAPGSHHVVNNVASPWDGDYVAPLLSVVGCQGPDEGIWEYDQPAEEVELDVGESEDGDTMRIEFVAGFADHSGTGPLSYVRGEFDYSISAARATSAYDYGTE